MLNFFIIILKILMGITPPSINYPISINVFFPASLVSWRLIDQRQAKRWPPTPKWLQVLTQEKVRGWIRNSFTPHSAAPLGGGVGGGPPASAWEARQVPGITADIKCVCSLDSEICLQNLIHLDVLSCHGHVYCENCYPERNRKLPQMEMSQET